MLPLVNSTQNTHTCVRTHLCAADLLRIAGGAQNSGHSWSVVHVKAVRLTGLVMVTLLHGRSTVADGHGHRRGEVLRCVCVWGVCVWKGVCAGAGSRDGYQVCVHLHRRVEEV